MCKARGVCRAKARGSTAKSNKQGAQASVEASEQPLDFGIRVDPGGAPAHGTAAGSAAWLTPAPLRQLLFLPPLRQLLFLLTVFVLPRVRHRYLSWSRRGRKRSGSAC